MLLAAQIWASVTNVFLLLPIIVLACKDLVHVYSLEATWLTLLTVLSSLYHVCDPATELIWSCEGNRDSVSFTEDWVSTCGMICMVTPFVQQVSPRVAAWVRIVLFPLAFALLLVDPYEGEITFAVLFFVLAPLFVWAVRTVEPTSLDYRQRWFVALLFALVGFVLFGVARYLFDEHSIAIETHLWIHGAWHVPIAIAMAIVLSTLESGE